MKKFLLVVAGLVSLGFLAFGVVKTLAVAPKTVVSAEDILETFYELRGSLPPLPS
jgi:hypothetical protein